MARARPRTPTPPATETLIGTAGDDSFTAILGSQARYSGLAGNDRLQGWFLSDTLDGGDGDDVLNDGDGRAGSTSGAADTLLGGAGNDVLNSFFGADLLDGGAGFDLAIFDRQAVPTGLTSSGALGSGSTLTLSDGTRFVNIEQVSLYLGAGADRITTGTGDDIVSSGAGNDVVSTLAGDDQLLGGAGNDRLDGGLGNDRLDGGFGTDVLIGGGGADVFQLGFIGGGLDRVVDFSFASGDRVAAAFGFGDASDESNGIFADPIAEGLLRAIDGSEGAFLQVQGADGQFTSVMLLVGVSADDFTIDFLI